jgi:hypothetical protein
MKKILLVSISVLILKMTFGQRPKEVSVALMNTNSAMPFNKFSGLITGVFHPGIELGYSFNWKTRKSHDWYQDLKLGYFYHRFVQHGIPLYTQLGYRYKFSETFHSDVALGAGYFHSIPATAKLKLQENGEYRNNKGVGRMQLMMTALVGTSYILNPSAAKPVRLFINYQQRLQTPFVKSYVPLLPYNSLMIGAAIPLTPKSIK